MGFNMDWYDQKAHMHVMVRFPLTFGNMIYINRKYSGSLDSGVTYLTGSVAATLSVKVATASFTQ